MSGHRFSPRPRAFVYTSMTSPVSRAKLPPLLVLLCTLIVAGCASSRVPAEEPARPSAPVAPTGTEVRIRSVVDAWGETPYLYGGIDRDGLDCSAFMQVVYRDVFDIDLPRSTAQQVREGQPVARAQLSPGDLVFFRPAYKQRHVGVYLSRGDFAHVSSSQGVTVSNLDEQYWQRSYWTARRIVGPAPVAEGRAGW